MKYGGPYKVHDCQRKTRAIANERGKIIFLNQDDMQDPVDQRLYTALYRERKAKKDAGMAD